MTANVEPERKWTLMFYFASDNPLAPGIVSLLKSLKNAGYQHDVNVVAQFDPCTKDTPTHIFDVNRVNKMKDHYTGDNIGFGGDDPYIRNLVLDKLWGSDQADQEIKTKVIAALKAARQSIDYHAPEPAPYKKAPQQAAAGKEQEKESPVELSPYDSLKGFLEFCGASYPAERYMLFIIGHGLVVGNDMFLYDSNAAKESLSLNNLKTILQGFNTPARKGKLELLALHSCSMSSLEVTYELQGLANYMIASQGPAFVGSWPYREILIRIFKDNDKANETTITKIFDYILYNSFDFQLAGYSFDLCLSRLSADLSPLTVALRSLCKELIDALEHNPVARQLIILAHWDAQSYWQEMYTDLSDFCLCLTRRCQETLKATKDDDPVLLRLIGQSAGVIKQFKKEGSTPQKPDVTVDKGNLRTQTIADSIAETDTSNSITVTEAIADLIVRAEFAGPESQYSKGLSVYFPWSEPIDHDFWLKVYPQYEEFMHTGWYDFLKVYFDRTMREPVYAENENKPTIQQELIEKMFNVNGELSPQSGTLGPGDGKPGSGSAMGSSNGKPGGISGMGPGDGKPGGTSGTGIGCDCPSIKNYPSFIRKHAQQTNGSDPAASNGLRIVDLQ